MVAISFGEEPGLRRKTSTSFLPPTVTYANRPAVFATKVT